MIEKIQKYCDVFLESSYCTIATVYDLESQDVYIMLAPEYSLNEGDTVYDESELFYHVLHTDNICADEDCVKIISDLLQNKEIVYAKGKIIKEEF